MRVDILADVKEEAMKTSGVVRFDNRVEVLLKMNGTTMQEPAAQKLVAVLLIHVKAKAMVQLIVIPCLPTVKQSMNGSKNIFFLMAKKSAVFAEKNSYVNRK